MRAQASVSTALLKKGIVARDFQPYIDHMGAVLIVKRNQDSSIDDIKGLPYGATIFPLGETKLVRIPLTFRSGRIRFRWQLASYIFLLGFLAHVAHGVWTWYTELPTI